MLWKLSAGVSRTAAKLYRSKPFCMRNRAPVVSFTFDDVPDSAYLNGAAILENHGIRGTFYIAGGICGAQDEHWRVIDREQVGALYDAGHEIGCHTFSHINVESLDALAMNEECRRNENFLRGLRPDMQLTNFCYPFGRVSLARKLQLQERFDSCRGIYEGINAGTIDLGLLRVMELYDRTLTQERLERVMRLTCARSGWLIFYTHDVADPPSWIGCSPELLRSAIERVQAMGLACMPIRDALQAVGYVAGRAQHQSHLAAPFGRKIA
jgi:peptidoglycan/xylan/chitin deacetylase (PgdA/CDA1 family)